MTTSRDDKENYISSKDLACKRAEQMADQVKEGQRQISDIVDMLKHPQYVRYFRPWFISKIANMNKILLARPMTESESNRIHGRREAYEGIINHFDNLIRQYAESGGIEIVPEKPESSMPKES